MTWSSMYWSSSTADSKGGRVLFMSLGKSGPRNVYLCTQMALSFHLLHLMLAQHHLLLCHLLAGLSSNKPSPSVSHSRFAVILRSYSKLASRVESRHVHAQVARGIRQAGDDDGTRVFPPEDWLTAKQVQSYFSRLASANKHLSADEEEEAEQQQEAVQPQCTRRQLLDSLEDLWSVSICVTGWCLCHWPVLDCSVVWVIGHKVFVVLLLTETVETEIVTVCPSSIHLSKFANLFPEHISETTCGIYFILPTFAVWWVWLWFGGTDCTLVYFVSKATLQSGCCISSTSFQKSRKKRRNSLVRKNVNKQVPTYVFPYSCGALCLLDHHKLHFAWSCLQMLKMGNSNFMCLHILGHPEH